MAVGRWQLPIRARTQVGGGVDSVEDGEGDDG